MADEVDLSEFFAMTNRRACKVALTLEALPPAKRRKLEAALEYDAGRIPHSVIHKWVIDNGDGKLGNIQPSADAIRRHRVKQCGCV